MTNILTTTRLTRGLGELLLGAAGFWFNENRRHASHARTMKILHELSDEQLTDIGIDPSLVHVGPRMHVDARLMTTLLSLR
ncbi:DUF1127 domain-containing protein [Neorhizobium alkalisoli]|uniref:DUF1127 domain-containing protein n=1 Tax=Neorhizobium alkalisoli TaxID=528178 RepID=UPI000CF8CFAA|nr:DUF1127 domain-containing protein [Neorhizobium alkalisoli]